MSDLVISYRDDKKERFQSHEVHARVETSYASADIAGYGANKLEAFEEAKHQAREVIRLLQEFLEKPDV